MPEFAPTLENAAVFFNGSRRFKNVNVAIVDDQLHVMNRTNGAVMATWTLTDVAKVGEAWDVVDSNGVSGRLVAQLGCGCSGMKSYTEDQDYKDRHK